MDWEMTNGSFLCFLINSYLLTVVLKTYLCVRIK